MKPNKSALVEAMSFDQIFFGKNARSSISHAKPFCFRVAERYIRPRGGSKRGSRLFTSGGFMRQVLIWRPFLVLVVRFCRFSLISLRFSIAYF